MKPAVITDKTHEMLVEHKKKTGIRMYTIIEQAVARLIRASDEVKPC
jgi:hypothetical protein